MLSSSSNFCGKKYFRFGPARQDFPGKRPAQGPGKIPAKDRQKTGKRPAKDQHFTGPQLR